MQNEKLAPVFLDNQPVNLQDPNPKVSAILSACGLPDATDLKWVQFQPTDQGRAMRPDETLDRTSEPTKPIYLTSAVDGKFAGATVLRGKTNIGGQQSGAGGQGQASQSQGRQGQGEGSQSQERQGQGSQAQERQGQGQGARKAEGNEGSGASDEHGAEWRRAGGRPNPAGQKHKSEATEGAAGGREGTDEGRGTGEGKKSGS